jgi:hypothetical protein
MPRLTAPIVGVLAAAALLPALAAAQVPAPPTMQQSWWDRAAGGRVGPFVVKSDMSQAMTERLVQRLTSLHAEFARLAPQPPRTANPPTVLLFSSRQELQDTLRTRFGMTVEQNAMFFHTPDGGAMAIAPDLQRPRRFTIEITHEAFHHYAAARFGADLPIWLGEGLAELYGSAVGVHRTLLLRQANPRVLSVIRQAVEQDSHVPFARLLTMTVEDWQQAVTDGRGPLMSAQAWSMAHCLAFADANRDNVPDHFIALQSYLTLLQRAYPQADAFARAFGTEDTAEFERQWKEHVMSLSPGPLAGTSEHIEFLAEGALELHRRGVIPESLDELRERLKAIAFTTRFGHHGIVVTLSAESDELFSIPWSPGAGFEVSRVNVNRLTRQQRDLEAKHPSPPVIRTTGLSPLGVEVAWVRLGPEGGFTYDIIVK